MTWSRPAAVYFSIKLDLDQAAPIPLLAVQAHDELYLGPHVRLAGLAAMAHIGDEGLARQYAAACKMILEDRYGSEVTLTVGRCVDHQPRKTTLARIERDTEIVRQRLKTNNFIPNKPPHG